MVKKMTEGSPVKLILGFFFPLFIGNLFQYLYNMVDSLIVGRYLGKAALAAVGSTGSISFLIIGFMNGMASGFSVLLSRIFGAKDEDRLRRCTFNIIIVSAVITAVVTALSCIFLKSILRLLNTPDDMFQMSYDYLYIILLYMGVTMAYNVLSGMLRAVGDSKHPLIFLIVAALVNVVLDLVFIIVFDLGVAGAAYATMISQFVAALCCFIFIIVKVPEYRIRRSDARINHSDVYGLCGMGIPMALQFSITAIGSIMIQSAMNGIGTDFVAAATASGKVGNLIYMPMESLGITMATYCGQNLGAGKADRIFYGVRMASWMNFIYSVVTGAIMFFFGISLASVFVDSSETAVLEYASDYLKILAYCNPILAYLYIFRNSVQGLGYGAPAMLCGIFELVGRGVIATVFATQVIAIYLSGPIAWLLADIFLFFVYRVVKKRVRILCSSTGNSAAVNV